MEQFDELEQWLSRCCPDLEWRREEPMARYTTFRIGGPARLMAFPNSEEQVAACVNGARRAGVRLVVLGNGSNLLAADEGIRAFVVNLSGLDGVEQTAEHELRAGAGITLARLATYAADRGLAGLEFAHGIPGTLGGGVMMNAGAYGGEMADVVSKTRSLTLEGELRERMGGEHHFAYRHSVFSGRGEIILSSVLTLQPGEGEEIRSRMRELAQRRRSKQPLEYPSAGSMFKRPEGHFAAALIDQCGLKGFSVGGAQVSEKHAGFVVNRGGATCKDVLDLVAEVQRRVLEQTGVPLEMEVRVLS